MAYTGPTFVGVSTGVGSTGAASVVFTSSGRAAGDMLVLGVATANEASSPPTGFVQVPGAANPQSRGTAAAAGGLRGTIHSKTSNGSETTVSVPDSGNHQYGVGLVVRPSGGATAVEVEVLDGANAAAATSCSFPGVTTTTDNCLIVTFAFTDRDADATANWSGYSGGAANLTERFDSSTTSGVGSGIAILTAEKETAGATGTISATQATSAVYASITLAIRNVSTGTTVSPTGGSVFVSGNQPTVARTANQVVAPASGSVVFAGNQPAVSQVNDRVVSPSAGSVLFTGNVPVVTRTANRVIVPTGGSVFISGNPPTVVRTSNIVVQPAAGRVRWRGNNPSVGIPVIAAPVMRRGLRLRRLGRLGF